MPDGQFSTYIKVQLELKSTQSKYEKQMNTTPGQFRNGIRNT
jgi:hypothetical protein